MEEIRCCLHHRCPIEVSSALGEDTDNGYSCILWLHRQWLQIEVHRRHDAELGHAFYWEQPGLRISHKEFWDELAQLITKYNVKILGGDWNKSLMKVVPELRSRGILIETVAWYPWCGGPQRSPHADSMALFVVNTILERKLCVELSAIGQSWPASESWPESSGPGMAVASYLPQTGTLSEKMQMLLEPEFPTRDAMERKARELGGQSSGSTVVDPDARKWLATREKRLMHQILALNGQFYKGSHFPLCFFTANTGHRSEEAHKRRKGKQRKKQRAREAASRPQSRSHGGGASVGAEPAYVELPTNASGVTQSLFAQARQQWSAEEYQQWNEDRRSWSSWGYSGTQGWWSGKLQ